MEFRVLQYFLAVTKEGSISAAANSLHLSQPTLSRQLKELECELGKQLFIRSNRKITLTEEGMILRKRAEEITELVKKTQIDISSSDKTLSGDIYIGSGETVGVKQIAKVAKELRNKYPLLHFHIISGDKTSVLEELDRGLIDFALVFGDIDFSKYDSLMLPSVDQFCVMMRKDDILANKEIVNTEDLIDKPLIVSRQILHDSNLKEIFGYDINELNIVATYNLFYNGSLMVSEGIGYAICFDNIVNVTGDSNLCLRPLSIKITPKMNLIWKKYQIFTKPAGMFIEAMKRNLKSL